MDRRWAHPPLEIKSHSLLSCLFFLEVFMGMVGLDGFRIPASRFATVTIIEEPSSEDYQTFYNQYTQLLIEHYGAIDEGEGAYQFGHLSDLLRALPANDYSRRIALIKEEIENLPLRVEYERLYWRCRDIHKRLSQEEENDFFVSPLAPPYREASGDAQNMKRQIDYLKAWLEAYKYR